MWFIEFFGMPLDRPNRAVSFSGIHIVHSSIMKFIKPFYRLLSFSTVKPSVRLFLGFFAVMWLTSCGTSKQLPEMNSTQQLTDCTRVPFHSISATQQDALPGVESNLRKQRTYRLEMGIPAEEGDGWLNVLESINQWELWVDSVAVPLRFQPMQADMSIAFQWPSHVLHHGPVKEACNCPSKIMIGMETAFERNGSIGRVQAGQHVTHTHWTRW